MAQVPTKVKPFCGKLPIFSEKVVFVGATNSVSINPITRRPRSPKSS